MTEHELVDLAKRLRAFAEHLWPALDEYASEYDDLQRSAAAIERLVQEVSRCHERLEIDHYWRLGDNDDSDLERVEIPMDERAAFPDAVAARDATIALAEARASSAEAQLAEMRGALRKIVSCYDRNWQHQREKLDDIVPMARAALEQSQ